MEFDGLHRWCCNRPLCEITYEDCTVEGLYQTGMVWSDENGRITCRFKGMHISCREGCETLPLLVAGNFDRLIFEDCLIEGYTEPTVLVGTESSDPFIAPLTVRAPLGTEGIRLFNQKSMELEQFHAFFDTKRTADRSANPPPPTTQAAHLHT